MRTFFLIAPSLSDLCVRLRTGYVCLYFLPAVLSSVTSTAIAADDENTSISELLIGETYIVNLPAGASNEHKISLRPGNYLLTVGQQGRDVHLTVSGATTMSVNSPTLRDEVETVLLEVELESDLSIAVANDEYTEAAGGYSIVVVPVESDRDIAALRLITRAGEANLLRGDENWANALEYYKQALELWEQSDNYGEQARARYSIAYLHYWVNSNWSAAADEARKAAALYRQTGNAGLEANAIHMQAAAMIEAASESASAGDKTASGIDAAETFGEALALFGSALEIQTTVGNGYDRAQTINNIGLTHYYRDDWTEATPYFEQAADEFRELKEWSAELNPLANIAVIKQVSGELIAARDSYFRLLELLSVEREPSWRADTLDNLATAQLQLGDPDSALINYNAALLIHEELGEEKGQGRSLTGIASTYLAIGEFELARDSLERALPIRQKTHDGRGQIAAMRSLANVYIQLGQADKALEYQDRALELASTPVARASLMIQKARDRIDLGDFASAETALADALAAADEAGAAVLVADAAYQSGRLHIRSGETVRGREWLLRANDSYAAIGVQSGQARSMLELARSYATEDIDQSIRYAKQALDHVESLRSHVSDLELRAVFLGTRSEFSEFLIDRLMQAAFAADLDASRDHYTNQALEVAERARARSTVDLINEAAVDLSTTVDPAIYARQIALRELIAEKRYQRDKLLEEGEDPGVVQIVVGELQRFRTELDVLETQARNENPRYADLSDPAVLDADQIRQELDTETLVLQYALAEQVSYVWIISSENIRAVAIPSRNIVNDLSRQVYDSLTTFDHSPAASQVRQERIDALSEAILRPAAPEISTKKRLVIAADGVLQYLPFSILTLDDGSALIDSHDTVVVPSMTVVSTHRKAIAGRPLPGKTIALVGDPVFNDVDERLPSVFSDATTRGPGAVALEKYNEVRELERLPYSSREVEQIASLVKSSERFVVTGFDATKSAVSGAQLGDYRYVHLATHGIIDSEEPALSALVLSLRDSSGSPLNGFLRLHDIYNMQLNADLVVMSACDTALGRHIRGEGLIGLTQGFLYAGTASVVASLWQVPDRATSELMTRFYRNLLEGHMRPAQALRTAQIQLSAERRWSDPYYWSGFVVQGEWR